MRNFKVQVSIGDVIFVYNDNSNVDKFLAHDDEFMDLPGPSTRGRQKSRCESRDSSGQSTKNVGSGSEELVVINIEEKKREAARLRKAKSRSKKTELQLEEEREKERIRIAKYRTQETEKKNEAQLEEEREKERIRIAKYRSQENEKKNEAQLEEERKKERNRIAKFRGQMTEDEKIAVRVENQLRTALIRDNMSHNERAKAREEDCLRKAQLRENMDDDQRSEVRRSERLRKARLREDMTTDQQAEEREQDRTRKTIQRRLQSSKVSSKDGLKSQEVMDGRFLVPLLEDSNDKIGTMDVECPHCGALKFRKESPGSCCSNGKVSLTPFPRPPSEIMALWKGNDADSKTFRKYSREINNSFCLSSIMVNEKRFAGFTPSVIFQGQVRHLAGPILPHDNTTPRFAQLYCYDPALENTQRFRNLTLPTTTSAPQKEKLKKLLPIVQKVLHEHNPFIKDFKQISELPDDQLAQGKIVISATNKPANEHPRRYNAPNNLQEVSILTNEVGKHDLVLYKRGGGLKTISDMNPKGMPLRFTLLFPFGTYGWSPEEKHMDGIRRVTTKEFFAYHMQVRNNDNENYLHNAGRLYQEWLCVGWINIESQRLIYQALNQKALRADTYQNVREATDERIREAGSRADNLHTDDHQTPAIGRKILASSFIGSPRWWNAKFQDAMAICRAFRKPDMFITMTCNPQWTEIQDHLFNNDDSPQNRADVVARVFKLKRDQLMRDLTKGELLGTVVAYMHVTEYQKRGLPHEHILLILSNEDRHITPEFVNSFVVAELPPNPEDTEDPIEKEQRKRLETIVLNNMVHGPCGEKCMIDGKCSKGYPKEFKKDTMVDQESNYATYRRRKYIISYYKVLLLLYIIIIKET